MQIIPKSTAGLAPFVMVTFLIAVIFFTQQYGWVNWNRWFSKSTTEA